MEMVAYRRAGNMRLGRLWMSALSRVNIESVPAGFLSIAAVIYSPARAIDGVGIKC